MTTNDFKSFLIWLKNRLKYKYKEQDPSIMFLFDCLINNHYFLVDHRMKEFDLLEVCKRNYPNWDYEKDVDSLFDVGYTNEEREDIKDFVTNLGRDILEVYNK